MALFDDAFAQQVMIVRHLFCLQPMRQISQQKGKKYCPKMASLMGM